MSGIINTRIDLCLIKVPHYSNSTWKKRKEMRKKHKAEKNRKANDVRGERGDLSVERWQKTAETAACGKASLWGRTLNNRGTRMLWEPGAKDGVKTMGSGSGEKNTTNCGSPDALRPLLYKRVFLIWTLSQIPSLPPTGLTLPLCIPQTTRERKA